MFSFPLKHHIRFTDDIGLWLRFQNKQVNQNLIAYFFYKFQQVILRHDQHTTCTARSIIVEIGSILDLIPDKDKN